MKTNAVACAMAWLALQGAAWAQLGPAPMPQLQSPQAQPSLEATQQWITGKLAEIGAVRKSDQEWHRYEAWFDGCRFSVLELTTRYATAELKAAWPGQHLEDIGYPRLLTGSLEDIDTTSQGPSVRTIGGREAFRFSFHNWESHKLLRGPVVARAMAGDPQVRPAMMQVLALSTRQEPTALLTFGAIDHELQHRLARAFRHAAAECVKQRAEAAAPRPAKRPEESF